MNDPVIKNLRPHTWSSEESVAYEAAIEAINGVIGVCSGLLTDAENRGVGEEASAYRRLRATCHQERRALRAEDTEGVARVRATYAARLRELMENEA
ncbi:hypothetical protein [Streptomyces recifensis]|uniref:hypothetical protein n=1 Tax=Streptomyces recifensis TaxID=67355 RepID=UPI000A36E556|nr:hypothetical protein [Streptomyces recifensis]